MGLPSDGVRQLAEIPAQWFGGRGPQADIILCSRARLARNLTNQRFPQSAHDQVRQEVLMNIKAAAYHIHYFASSAFFLCQDLGPVSKQALVERRIASQDLMQMPAGAGLMVDREQTLSLMINEEDHIRLQAVMSGLDLLEAFRVVDQIDDMFQARLDYAYSPEWGFLTACPTNVGTGLRASVLIHLPALVLTRRIDEVLKAMVQIGMTVRGLYGEGSEVLGHLFQVSNRTSLGSTELEIIEGVERAARHLLEAEGRARQVLWEQARHETEDKVWRALGIMERARVLSSEEFLNLSSAVRLGLSMGIIDRPGFDIINQLIVLTQPAHLQLYCDEVMEPRQRDVRRAELVREKINERPS